MLRRLKNRIKSVNEAVAVFITNMVGTMWCAYFFTCVAMFSLQDAIRGGTSSFVSWFSQTFCQFTLLSIIIVGQKLEGKYAEKRAKEDHEALLKIVREVTQVHQDIHTMGYDDCSIAENLAILHRDAKKDRADSRIRPKKDAPPPKK